MRVDVNTSVKYLTLWRPWVCTFNLLLQNLVGFFRLKTSTDSLLKVVIWWTYRFCRNRSSASDSAYSYTFLRSVVCLSVVCHIRGSCLNRLTDWDAIRQVGYTDGVQWHIVLDDHPGADLCFQLPTKTCSCRAATWSLKSTKVSFLNTWSLLSLNLKKWSLKSLFLCNCLFFNLSWLNFAFIF